MKKIFVALLLVGLVAGFTHKLSGQLPIPRSDANDSRPLAIYVTDALNGRIVRVQDMIGTGWTTSGTTGEGTIQFKFPWDIALDVAGRIIVADYNEARVVRVDNISGISTRRTPQTRSQGSKRLEG